MGLTFRYAPAIQYMFDLVREGKIGTPWLFNGYEQNSQWLNPWYPQDKRLFKEYPHHLKKVGEDPDPRQIEVGSLEGYGAPTIDIGLELIQDDIDKLVCTMANLVPERRRYNVDDHMERINWDDADMWIANCKKGGLFSMQTSFVTVGNYPGIYDVQHLRLPGRAARNPGNRSGNASNAEAGICRRLRRSQCRRGCGQVPGTADS